jgi:hypothetical protein
VGSWDENRAKIEAEKERLHEWGAHADERVRLFCSRCVCDRWADRTAPSFCSGDRDVGERIEHRGVVRGGAKDCESAMIDIGGARLSLLLCFPEDCGAPRGT